MWDIDTSISIWNEDISYLYRHIYLKLNMEISIINTDIS